MNLDLFTTRTITDYSATFPLGRKDVLQLRAALILLIIFLFLSQSSVTAARFYFSSSTGDDSRNFIEARDPRTPWRSIEKLNAVFGSLRPGDSVFFKRGDVFFGSIELRSPGSPQRPIVIGAYGEGEMPLISGFQELENWTSVGNGIFKSGTVTTGKANILLIDGTVKEMGRFPNNGFLKYTTLEAGSNVLISEKDLTSLHPLEGTVVVRKNQWIIDKHKIEAVDGRKVAFSGKSSYPLTNDYGFFIQDHLSTLDSFGEWYHDATENEIYVFFGDSFVQHDVKASAIDHLVTNSSDGKNIVIENLQFAGANKSSFQLIGTEGIHITNCKIAFSGENALTAMDVPRLTVQNSEINFSNNSGLFLRYGTPNAVIKNNLIQNTHLFAGMAMNGDGNGMAIHSVSDEGIIEGNKIFNTGYSGVVFTGNGTVVKHNYINSFCLVKNDGGGIYVYEGARNRDLIGLKITDNIIVNGLGTTEGARMNSRFSKPQVEGIYLDDNSSGIEVRGNSIANMSRNAINFHNVRNVLLEDNTVFNGSSQLSLFNDELGDPIRDVTVANNVFFAAKEYQNIVILSSTSDDLLQMANFSGNTYVFPKGNAFVFQTSERNGTADARKKNLSFQQWIKNPAVDHDSQVIELDGYRHTIEKMTDVGKSYRRIDPASRDISCLDEDCNLSVTKSTSGEGGSLTAAIGKYGSGIKINLGPTDPLSQYALRLHLSSPAALTISSTLRHNGHPWSNIYEPFVFDIDPATEYVEKIVSFPDGSDKAAVILTIDNEEGVLNLDKVEWFKVDVSTVRPEILFQYNPTWDPVIFDVPEGYSDIYGSKIPNRVLIDPFASILLIKRD